MKVQTYIGILAVVGSICALGSTASAVALCNRAIPTGPFFCGTSRAQAQITGGGSSVKYHVASNGRPVTGVPVTVTGARVPRAGGGTCAPVSASRAGQITETTCPMARPNDAKRYIVNEQ